MYSLDINFLSDRAEKPEFEGGAGVQSGPVNWTPAILGAVVGLLPLLAVGGAWLFFGNSNAGLAQELAQLESQLQEQQQAQQRLQDAIDQAEQAEDDARALVTVFDQIKPWSALLQSFRDAVPSGVQISSIQQGENEDEGSQITITGNAVSFDNVNDFLLGLERSPFLNADETNLQSANLVDNPTEFALPDDAPSGVEVRLPQVVEYAISTELNDLPASELLPELESTLAVGLTSRIQALQDLQERGAF
ncbi:MAG: PilN domain-containing protein [Elainellaceae cyanobacterium]